MFNTDRCKKLLAQQRGIVTDLEESEYMCDEFYAASVVRLRAFCNRTEKLLEELVKLSETLDDASDKMTLSMHLMRAQEHFNTMLRELQIYAFEEPIKSISVSTCGTQAWNALNHHYNKDGQPYRLIGVC